MKDKFTALWVSHSSISDYLKCPRAYYLNNVYKDPKSGRKIHLMQPALALGQVVHEMIEGLSIIPTDKRFNQPLLDKFELAWKKVSGKFGGFKDYDHEFRYKNRGIEMLKNLIKNPGPLKNKAVKIHQTLPHYWFSEPDDIILCGKVDWLEYIPETDSVHIIDFKTGKYEEDSNSLQLPIYHLLVHNCQKRKVSKASFWYIERSQSPVEIPLPDLDSSYERVLKIAKQIKLLRQLSHYKCKFNGCSFCMPLEKIIKGEAEFVGMNEFNKKDIYISTDNSNNLDKDSSIL